MSLFQSNNLVNSIKGKDIFLDNDFLNELFKSEEFFASLINIIASSYPIIEPLISFEFLQTVYVPKEINPRVKFLNSELFYPAINHIDIFLKMQENALILSKVYAHSKQFRNPSAVDLLLAGRIMFSRQKDPYLITGNKKDYPSCVFDTVDMFAWEDTKDGSVKNYFVLRFNKGKFDRCFAQLSKLT